MPRVLFSLFLLIRKTFLWMGSTFPSGQMEQPELAEVKGHAPVTQPLSGIWTIRILQAPETLWFPKLSMERAKTEAAAESGGGMQVTEES